MESGESSREAIGNYLREQVEQALTELEAAATPADRAVAAGRLKIAVTNLTAFTLPPKMS